MEIFLIAIYIILFVIIYAYLNPISVHKLFFGTLGTVYPLCTGNFNSENELLIGITIDDVPYRDHSILEAILNTFKSTPHKLTFFVISSFVNELNKYLLVRAVKEGHMLANHGITDRCHYKLSNDELEKEIFGCQKVIESIYKEAGVLLCDTIYYRPGYGYVNSHMKYLEQDLSQQFIFSNNNWVHDIYHK